MELGLEMGGVKDEPEERGLSGGGAMRGDDMRRTEAE